MNKRAMQSRHYDAIIIGAGIIGLATACYLKRKGCRRVLVLEKEESWVTGSSARANGGFRQQFSTSVNIRLSQLSLPVFERFKEEFNTDIAFQQKGYLFLAATESAERALKKNIAFQTRHGVPVEWLDADQIGSVAPYVRVDDLRGGCFCRKDGYADSYSIAAGFGRKALELGAEILFQHEFESLQTDNGRVTAVVTSQGKFSSNVVVNAAGPWAGQIGDRIGVEIPVAPVRRMLVMTEEFDAIPAGIPMVIDADTGFLMRTEGRRILMAWSDPEEPPAFNLQFDSSFIDIVADKAVKRVPVLSEAQINPKRCWAGLYEVTPDHHCILGPVPELPGLFLAVGFSGHGMMHSPAIGQILADLILEGSTDLIDPHPLRLSRFSEGDMIEETVVL